MSIVIRIPINERWISPYARLFCSHYWRAAKAKGRDSDAKWPSLGRSILLCGSTTNNSALKKGGVKKNSPIDVSIYSPMIYNAVTSTFFLAFCNHGKTFFRWPVAKENRFFSYMTDSLKEVRKEKKEYEFSSKSYILEASFGSSPLIPMCA